MKWAVLAAALLTGLAVPAGAAAAPRWYVATDRTPYNGTVVSGYAVDGAAPVPDDLTLTVERGGVPVAGDSGTGFVQLLSASLQAGDTLVLADATTAVTRTVTFTGLPTLVAPACGAAAFSGARVEGASVSVTAPDLAAVAVSGAGTFLSGAFAAPMVAGATVKATMRRAVDATFTAFDAVSAIVAACPDPVPVPPGPAAGPSVPASPPEPVVTPAAAPAADVAPAPVAPPADTLAPAGRTVLRPGSAAALYRALRAGTFASSVSISEASTIRQTLVAGPAVLGAASFSATRAGTFSVTLKLSAAGRRRLAAARTSRLTLRTTLRDAAGNVRTLPSRTLVARR